MHNPNVCATSEEVLSYSSDSITILNCIHRIDEILDEELRLLDKGALNELERVNVRKTHLLSEFSRLAPAASPALAAEINSRLATCRHKAERNFEALGTYLRAIEDLNRMVLDYLRIQESDGTYSRPTIYNRRD